MPNKKSTKISLASLILGAAILSHPAYAGFEWRAGDDGTNYQQPSSNTFAPAPSSPATSAPEIISPVVITGDTSSDLPTTIISSSSQQPAPQMEQPSVIVPHHMEMPPSVAGNPDLATTTISVSPAATTENVRGFASSIPLTLAMHQIVPASYNFSLDQDVDMNTLVSYKGGKPWRDTLQDALAPAGLVEHEQGNNITISRGNAPMLTPAATASLPPIAAPRTISTSSYLVPPASAQTPSSSPAFAPVSMQDGWDANRGQTLRKVLTEWCARANVELQWQAEYDYPVEASAHFNNGFEDAVRNLLVGFDSARPQPIGELHTNNNAGQKVLVVQTRGNNYSN